jgi:alpha-glucosidase
MDMNGDGVGDLAGIINRLDYLQWLGIDVIWLSPIYPSPMADFGYDVSNYTDIHPLFGNLAQFDNLVAEAHRRGIKIVLDFVPNHTSSEHPWFIESRSSRTNPKRDWYIWKDPGPNGGPPNNWLSHFGGRAWTKDSTTGQYYYHAFLAQQPDLNWRNENVQNAMLDVLRFWLDRGVDGFRIDVIWHIVKDEQFRDNPPNPSYHPQQTPYNQLMATFSSDQPEVHHIITKIRSVLDNYGERMMVGEIYLPVEKLMTYYGAEGKGVHLPFNFQLIQLPWNPRVIAEAVQTYENMLPLDGWPNWVLGNHDNPRIARRAGVLQTRVAAMLLLTLRGTPTMYYGDEIGMEDTPIPPDAVQDPYEKNVPGLGLGRDPARTPMQWDSSPNAGFSTEKPWLPVGPNYTEVNVAVQKEDPCSLLRFYRDLIQFRKSEPAFSIGSYHSTPPSDSWVAYFRKNQTDQFLVVLNFTDVEHFYRLQGTPLSGRIVFSSCRDRENEQVGESVRLRPHEGLVIKLPVDL